MARTQLLDETGAPGEGTLELSTVRLHRLTGVVAVLACLAWAPFIGAAANSDEGGYLEVAAQWSPGGNSLYGNYWVDRPPLLIAIHAVAAALGGVVALRLIGIAAVVISVYLAAGLVRSAVAFTAPARRVSVAQAVPVVVAGTFLSTPLFGTTEVNGELLSVPFVLAGVVALVRAQSARDVRHGWAWASGAGCAAVAAAMVKQNAVDVFVAAAVVLIVTRRDRVARSSLRLIGGFVVGALTTSGVVLGAAAMLGTGAAGLWDAVVVFRFEAAAVIGRSATSATPHRAAGLLLSAAASAAPLVVVALLLRLRRSALHDKDGPRSVDLRWVGAALLLWETVAIAGGGSYWLHYLLVLVPGLVVLAASAAQRPAALDRLTTAAVSLAVASAIGAVAVTAASPRDDTDLQVASYLRLHARPGDDAIVAFGHPDILWDSGLESPYAELWSLPVKVRDPKLASFDAVLRSATAPEWVVVDGTSLAMWGVDASKADRTLAARYHVVAEVGSYRVWRRE